MIQPLLATNLQYEDKYDIKEELHDNNHVEYIYSA